MKCESCGGADANVHLSHVVNDVARQMNLCEECAAKHGINLQGSMSLTDILLGLGSMEESPDALAKTCGFCGMKLADLKRMSRLGCPVCYSTFGSELKPTLAGLQKGTHHKGKSPRVVPAEAVSHSRVAELTGELESAIAAEDYEAAATLRDEICVEKAKREPGDGAPGSEVDEVLSSKRGEHSGDR